jgi:DNA-binding transcriptional LysR family regulator
MTQPPKVTVEMGSNETIKQAVMADLGLSLISAHTIASEVAAGRLVILKVEGQPHRPTLPRSAPHRSRPAAPRQRPVDVHRKKGSAFLTKRLSA